VLALYPFFVRFTTPIHYNLSSEHERRNLLASLRGLYSDGGKEDFSPSRCVLFFPKNRNQQKGQSAI
jgi:hypothetical protein